MRSNLLLAGMLIIFLVNQKAYCADHYNLEENLPVEVTDAIPTPYLNREVQSLLRWEQTENKENKYTAEGRLEYGIFYNTQFEIHVPYEFGEAVDDGIGVTEASLLYNFNQESIWIPAIAISGQALFPTDNESEAVDPRVKLIMTKTVGRTSFFQRLHLNLSWHRDNDAKEDERQDLYKWVAGYDCRLNPETILIIDYVREQRPEKGKEYNIAEIGIRYQIHPRTVISIGGGAGLDEDSPDARATIGIQYSF